MTVMAYGNRIPILKEIIEKLVVPNKIQKIKYYHTKAIIHIINRKIEIGWEQIYETNC